MARRMRIVITSTFPIAMTTVLLAQAAAVERGEMMSQLHGCVTHDKILYLLDLDNSTVWYLHSLQNRNTGVMINTQLYI